MSTHRGPARHTAEDPDRGAAQGQEKSRLRALTLDQPPFSRVTHKEVPVSKRKPKRLVLTRPLSGAAKWEDERAWEKG